MSDNPAVPHVIPFPAARERYRMEIAMHVMAGFAAKDGVASGNVYRTEHLKTDAQANARAQICAAAAVLWADELLKALEKP